MSGPRYRVKLVDDVTGCVHSDSVVHFTHVCLCFVVEENVTY